MRKIGFLVFAIVLSGAGFWYFGLPSLSGEAACGEPVVRRFGAREYYEGVLIDSHVHMPVGSPIVGAVAKAFGFAGMPVLGNLGVRVGEINCLMKNEGVEKLFGFYVMLRFESRRSLSVFRKAEVEFGERVVPFFMPPPIKVLNIDVGSTRKLIEGGEGFFAGIGELAVYRDSLGDAMPDDEYFQGLYQIASEENLVVMIHVSEEQIGVVEKMVAKYPEVKFLFHGEDYVRWVEEMMDEYENFYYSLDANISSLYGFEGVEDDMEVTGEAYLRYIDRNFEEVLEYSLELWRRPIERYPDRFLWGTDRWFEWTYEPELSGALVEFGRAFIGQLNPRVQERFAYENARRLVDEE